MNIEPKIDEVGNVAHYSRPAHIANILHDKRLLLGPVQDFADPREATMSWIDTEGQGHQFNQQGWQDAKKIISDASRQIRCLCTAGPKQNNNHSDNNSPIEESIYGRPRMWAQYGDQSKGFCVVLDKKSLNKELQNSVKKPEYLISQQVEYFDWLSIVNGGSSIEYGVGIDPQDFDVFEKLNKNEMLRSIYFKKSVDWNGEQEYRWLLFDPSLNPLYVSIEKAIKAVVLGWKFPQNQWSQATAYCKELACPCYLLEYQHPCHKLQKLQC